MEAPGSRGGLFAPSALLKASQSISGGDTSSSLLEVDEGGENSEATVGLSSSHILSIEEFDYEKYGIWNDEIATTG